MQKNAIHRLKRTVSFFCVCIGFSFGYLENWLELTNIANWEGKRKRERDRSSSNSSSSKVANIFALIGYEETSFILFFCFFLFFVFVLKRTPSPKWEWMSPLSQQLMRHLLLLLSGLLFLSLFISPYLFTCGMATLHWANAMNPMQEITVKPLPFQHKWMRPLVHLSR